MGRPSKLTADVHDQIVDLMKAGNFGETAAACAGISRETLRSWLRRGARAKSGKFRRFRDDFVRAAAASESDLLTLIRNAAKGPDAKWQAAAWIMERKHPERFGRRQKLEVVPRTGAKDPFEGRTDDELAYYSDHGYFPDHAPTARLPSGTPGDQKGDGNGSG